jgi:hypothetical protein
MKTERRTFLKILAIAPAAKLASALSAPPVRDRTAPKLTRLDLSKEDNCGLRPMLPPGQYKVKCKYVVTEHSKRTGEPYLSMVWETVETPQPHTLFTYYSVSPKGLPRFKNLLHQMGIRVSKNGFDTDDLIGKRALARVEYRNGYYCNELFKTEKG